LVRTLIGACAMLSDDVYRSQLSRTFTDLVACASALADVAEVSHAQTAEYVRLSLLPYARGACAVEIMLRADQLYDISIGTEFYEDCRIQRLDVFVPLITAIVEGHVIQRRHLSAVTGTERGIETQVTLANGETWRKGHDYSVARGLADDHTVLDDRSFVPYRR
jgi:hypothetical protein